MLSTSHCHFGINKCLALLLSPVLTLFSPGPLHEDKQPNLPTLTALQSPLADPVVSLRLDINEGFHVCF